MISTVSFGDPELTKFTKDETEMVTAVQSIMDENMKMLKELSLLATNAHFAEPMRDYRFRARFSKIKDVVVNLHLALGRDPAVSTIRTMVGQKVAGDFKACRRKVEENFLRCRAVNSDMCRSKVVFSEADKLESFKGRLSLMKDFRRLANENMKDLFHGIVFFEVKATRSALEKHIEDSLKMVKLVLTKKFQKTLQTTRDEYENINSQLGTKVDALEDFCRLLRLRKTLSGREQELISRKKEIETTNKLLRSVGFSISFQDRSRYDEIMKLSESIETNKAQMEVFLDDCQEDYEKKLKESIDAHRGKIAELISQLANPDLGDSSISYEEAISRLHIFQDKLKKLSKKHQMLKEFW